ncbi:hypothetical protein [Paucibacter sp. B51]|uniref:hypothetical protein n=1 Tax=Paucibacter sp. B51 TaxID=2993315 RepID=UPI0022EC1594|nr:hypothetical protein [Paucibacter sp. B51]
MPKRYVQNDTPEFKIICGVLIPPFDGREVEVSDQDDPEPAAALGTDSPGDSLVEGQEGQGEGEDPAAARALANLRELLAASVKVISAGLAEHSDETLAGLLQLEQASETPRKSLLAAITELQLQRAQAKTGAPE